MTENIPKYLTEPYRLFFPLGILLLCWGALIWLPLIWTSDIYPVTAHRYLMLNGFGGSFIGGFLMTAVPKFSQTKTAHKSEVMIYLLVTLGGLIPAYREEISAVFLFSSLQPVLLLTFLFTRILSRKANPPYSFVFIFVGLFLWFISAIFSIFIDSEAFKYLHYEGAIASIILGVGSRLIPGILGHVEIVKVQQNSYEGMMPILRTVPLHFMLLIVLFIGSFFFPEQSGGSFRALVVVIIALSYWKLWQTPKIRSALTWCLWFSSWMIVLSFVIKAFWQEGVIHIGHSFFINGIVLLCLLIATRVIQSHGPQDKSLENRKVLYFVTVLLFLAAATRVSAFLIPELYLFHLAYSSVILVFSVFFWSWRYLRNI